MNEREFAELSAGHALHALSAEDEKAFGEALAAHPEWRHLVDADRETASVLADGAATVAPPSAAKSAVLAAIAMGSPSPAEQPADLISEGSATPDAAPKSARWGSRAWFALAASLTLILGVGGGAVLVSQQLSTPASVVALERIEGASDAQSATTELADGGAATLHWSIAEGEAVLVSEGLPSISSDEDFELWYVREGTPISAGVFDADAGAAVAQLSGQMHEGDVIAVTVEAQGGSPDGEPTSDPVLAIETPA